MKWWPWRANTEDESILPTIDKSQDARLEAAKQAEARTEKLLAKADNKHKEDEVHLREMHQVRTNNHFADLIRDYAFKGKT
jgi:hypothetical protein